MAVCDEAPSGAGVCGLSRLSWQSGLGRLGICAGVALALAACAPTMKTAGGRAAFGVHVANPAKAPGKLPSQVLPRAELDKVRKGAVPLLCGPHGPADDAAKKALDKTAKAVAQIKPRKNKSGCAPGEVKATCVNLGDGKVGAMETTLAISCEPGNIRITVDAGTYSFESLWGEIYKYRKDETLTLAGWDPASARVVTIEVGITGTKGRDKLFGSFGVVELGALAQGNIGEVVAGRRSTTEWEMFLLRSDGKSGILVSGPSVDPPITGDFGFDLLEFRVGG